MTATTIELTTGCPHLAWLAEHLGAADCAADVTLHDSAQQRSFRGMQAVEEQLAALFGSHSPPVQATLRRVHGDATSATLAIVVEVVHGWRLFGIAPTGRSVQIDMLVTGAFCAGALTQIWLQYDGGLLLQQLGLYAPVFTASLFPNGDTP
jgi:hypothetical protein